MRILYHNKNEKLTLLHFTNFNIYFIVIVFSPTQKKNLPAPISWCPIRCCLLGTSRSLCKTPESALWWAWINSKELFFHMNYFETLLSSDILGKSLSTGKHRHTSTSCKGLMGTRAGEEVDPKEKLGNTLRNVHRLKLSSRGPSRRLLPDASLFCSTFYSWRTRN